MKPPVSHEAVFGSASGKKERAMRAKAAATVLLDGLTAPAAYKRSKFESSYKSIQSAETAITNHSNALRDRYRNVLDTGMIFQAPTEEGGSITAVAVAHDDQRVENTFWRIQIESAGGRQSEFTADASTIYRGSSVEHMYPPTVEVVNPENGKQYSTRSYGDLGDLQASSTVATALRQLNQASEQGTLSAIPMPVGTLSQQVPDLLRA